MPHVTHRLTARRGTALLGALAAVLCALAVAAQPSRAGVLTASTSCAATDSSQVFLPWLDLASYQLAPDGGFEAGAEGWDLDGAATVAGNEPYHVGGSADASALRVPSGASATTPTFCVGIEHPTARLFAKRVGGSLLSTLRVDVRFRDALGATHELPIGVVTLNGGSWQPTLPMAMVASLLPLLPGDHTPVELRLVAQGGGAWLVDDVYVDPFKRA
jgi:hypothetical protein